MANYCSVIQEIKDVYDLGFEKDSYVCKILNTSLTGTTMTVPVFLALTGGTDYVYVKPTTLVPGDLVLGAVGDTSTTVDYCEGESSTTNWEYKIYTVKESSCLYSNKANIINSQYIWIPSQDIFYYNGTTFNWEDAHEVESPDLLLDISGNTVTVSGNTFDICTDRIYWNIQVEERVNLRVALFNGISRLVLASVDTIIVHPPAPSQTPAVTPTNTVTPTQTPTVTTTATVSQTATPAFSPSLTPTITPTKTQNASPTPTPTVTPTFTPTSASCSSGCYQWAIYNEGAVSQNISYTDCNGNPISTSVAPSEFYVACLCGEDAPPSGTDLVATFMGNCGEPLTAPLEITKNVLDDVVTVYLDGVPYVCGAGSDFCSFPNVVNIGQKYLVSVVVTPYGRPTVPISIATNNGVFEECPACTNAAGADFAGVTGYIVSIGV